MQTKEEVTQVLVHINKINDGEPLKNNEYISLMLVMGLEFPKVTSVQELVDLPVDSVVFDKNFQCFSADQTTPEKPANEKELFENHSPLHILYVV